MADNINITPGAGKTIAADDVSGVLHQRIKMVIGNDGTNDGDVSSTNPMPTTLTAAEQQLLQNISDNTGAQAIDFTKTGSITALNETVFVTGQGVYTVTAAISGTWSGTLVIEGQMADSSWQQIPCYLIASSIPWTPYTSITSNGNFVITGGGYLNIRVRASAWTSGTASVGLDGSLSQQTVLAAIFQSLPKGNNTIGKVKLSGSGTQEIFGNIVTSIRRNQIEAKFFDTTSSTGYPTVLTTTTSGGATLTTSGGYGIYTSGTATTANVKSVSKTNIFYGVGHELYVLFTASFTTPTHANSYQRLGLLSTTDGYYIGSNGLSFGVGVRKNSSDIFKTQSEFSIDTLTGGANSLFTRNGVPEAINWNNTNIFRIRTGWLGIGPIYYEVESPDGEWVVFHVYNYPNLINTGAHSQTPNLPVSIEINKSSADSTSLIVQSGAIAAGTTSLETNPTYDFSSVNLNSGANYTTPWFDSFAQGASFVVAIQADQNITYQIQFSPDQIITKTLDSSTVLANTSFQTPYIAQARYFRIIFTNSGGSATTSLFLSVIQDHFNIMDTTRIGDKTGLDMTFNNTMTDNIVRMPVLNAPIDGQKATYSAAALAFNAANNATDIFTLTGSATKTIRITKVRISATQTTGAIRDIVFIKRSTANSAGTPNAVTAVPNDSNNAAASATCVYYTGNPTLGTAVGNIRANKQWIAGTAATTDNVLYEFGNSPDQSIVLRGTSQVFAVNLNGVTSAGNSFNISISWTEE